VDNWNSTSADILLVCGYEFFQNLSITAANKRCDLYHFSFNRYMGIWSLIDQTLRRVLLFLILSGPVETPAPNF
jgi:hypothetical protein